jgi:hypothetical protein
MNAQTENQALTTADLVGPPQPQVDQPLTGSLTTQPTDQVVDTQPRASMAHSVATQSAPLFSGAETEDFRSRWSDIQTGFVDEPRRVVEQADSLVAEVIQRLATVFADERAQLEQQWGQGDDVSTEGLRVALQRYRSFFDRLLSV